MDACFKGRGIVLYRHFYRRKTSAFTGAGDGLGLRGGNSSASIVKYRRSLQLYSPCSTASVAPRLSLRDAGRRERHHTLAVPSATPAKTIHMTTKLFDVGISPDLNACVGNNTGSDDDHGYVTGFAQAALALIATAKQQGYVDSDSNEHVAVYVDALIYPIGYCARHHIELFLKRQIARVSSLRNTLPIVLDSTHVLGDLLDRLKELCATADRRLPALLAPLETAIAEFARIDKTGEAFRYRKSKGDETHLAEIGIINLQALGQGFARMVAAGEEFERVADAITYEYGQGTYTDKLSDGNFAPWPGPSPRATPGKVRLRSSASATTSCTRMGYRGGISRRQLRSSKRTTSSRPSSALHFRCWMLNQQRWSAWRRWNSMRRSWRASGNARGKH